MMPYSCTESLWSGYISYVTMIKFYDANALYRRTLIQRTTSTSLEQMARPLQVCIQSGANTMMTLVSLFHTTLACLQPKWWLTLLVVTVAFENVYKCTGNFQHSTTYISQAISFTISSLNSLIIC